MRLIFRCPYTNKPIETDVMLDRATALASASYPMTVFCPHCGYPHSGCVRDGELVQDYECANETVPVGAQ